MHTRVQPQAQPAAAAELEQPPRRALDLDGDGDVDAIDALLAASLGARLLRAALFWLFDTTFWLVPFGACVGGVLTFAGAAVAVSEAAAVESGARRLIAELQGQGLMPAGDLTALLGIDFSQAQAWVAASLGACTAVNALTIANGFYVGVQRTARRRGVVEPRPRCGGGSFAVVQAVFAVAGAAVLWASIALAYVASSVALLLLVAATLYARYCATASPLVDAGLQFSTQTLSATNATLHSGLGVYNGASQQAALLFSLSPIPALVHTVGGAFGVAQSALEQAAGVLASAASFGAFLDSVCLLAGPLPAAFVRCYAGGLLCLLGQVIVSKYHARYYTVFYYELALRRRRSQEGKAAVRE